MSLLPGNGPSVLIGGLGDDNLTGGDSDDVLRGGIGNDTINGGAQYDLEFDSGDIVRYDRRDGAEPYTHGVVVNLSDGPIIVSERYLERANITLMASIMASIRVLPRTRPSETGRISQPG